MTAQRDPEPTLAAWLDEGPTDLPSATRRAILTAIPTTPQARRGHLAPWRLSDMNPLARGALAAFVAVLVLGSTLLMLRGRDADVGTAPSASPVAMASPGPSASPAASAFAGASPSAGPARLGTLDATFVSPWYGYSVRYPEGWVVSSGGGPWPLGENLMHGNPHLDEIVSPAGIGRMRLVGASIALPAGMTMDGFRAFASPPIACEAKAPLPDPVLIDGVQALVSLNGCASLSNLGGNIYDLLVIKGGRGYDFTLDGDLTAAEAVAWLATIHLEPDRAPTGSAAPSPSGP